jgi:hypothetical protein
MLKNAEKTAKNLIFEVFSNTLVKFSRGLKGLINDGKRFEGRIKPKYQEI